MTNSRSALLEQTFSNSSLSEEQLHEILGMSSDEFLTKYESGEVPVVVLMQVLDEVSAYERALSTSVDMRDVDDDEEYLDDDGEKFAVMQWSVTAEQAIDAKGEEVQVHVLSVGDSSIVLSEDIRKELHDVLASLDPNKPKPPQNVAERGQSIIDWYLKHKVFGTFTAIFLAIILVSLVYGLTLTG